MQTNIAHDVAALASLFLRDAARFDKTAKGLVAQSVDFPITGGSMGTTLPKGVIVRVVLAGAESCAIGDIAIFRQGTQIVAHRVIRRSATHLITSGDARLAPDPPVPLQSVLGRVTGIIDRGSVVPLPACRRRRLGRIANGAAATVLACALRISATLAGRVASMMMILEHR